MNIWNKDKIPQYATNANYTNSPKKNKRVRNFFSFFLMGPLEDVQKVKSIVILLDLTDTEMGATLPRRYALESRIYGVFEGVVVWKRLFALLVMTGLK